MNSRYETDRALIVVSVVVVVVVASAIMTASLEPIYAYERKYYEQELLTNVCGNTEIPFNILCQNLASQLQGDANSVNAIGTMNAPSNITPQQGDTIHIVWSDNSHSGTLNFDILYKNSHNGGTSFGPSENLSNDPLNSAGPKVVASGNVIHAVWEEDLLGGEVLYRRSTDGGVTFGPTINLSNDLGSKSVDIAISGNNVYVVWTDTHPTGSRLMYTRSTDGGLNFEIPVNLDIGGEPRPSTSIAAFDNNVYIVWREIIVNNDEIFYKRSIDGGASFGAPINISNDPTDSITPDIAVSGGNVYIVWDDDNPGSQEIFYRRSIDGGASFGGTVNISNSPEVGGFPSVAAVENNVYIVWEDDDPVGGIAERDILFRRSLDGGANFESTVDISDNNQFSTRADVAAIGDRVYIVWRDFLGDPEILLTRSMDEGVSFEGPVNVSNNAGGSGMPSIAVS